MIRRDPAGPVQHQRISPTHCADVVRLRGLQPSGRGEDPVAGQPCSPHTRLLELNIY